MKKRAADAAPLYEAAYQQGASGITDPNVLRFLQLPHFQEAFSRAKRIAALEGRRLPEIMNSEGKLIQVPDLHTLDYVKRGLDDLIYSGKVTGSVGKAEERALKGARQQFLEHLDAAVPDYAQARAAYAGPTQLIEAAQAGMQFAKLRPEEVRHTLTTAFTTPAEREHYLLGAVDAIRTSISNAADGADTYKRVFGNLTKREQLRALFPSKEAYDNFAAKMETERQMRITADAVRGNSRTTYRQAALEDLGQDPASFTTNALTGGIRSAVGKELIGRAQGNVGKNAEATVPLLFQDPMAALEVLKRTHQKIQQQGAAPARSASPLGVVGGLLGAR